MIERIKICEKALLSVSEIMAYTGWGENTVRDELNRPKCHMLLEKEIGYMRTVNC